MAQVESVNLALRNSRVTDVSLRLVGTQVVEQNYPIAGSTLNDLSRIFDEGIRFSEPDMIYGIFSGHPDDTAVGWGQTPGRLAIGWVYGEAFRHEVGHNAGGVHCHVPGGGYNFGFDNGKSSTAQCGNGSPFYSTPAVRDQHGLPLGNAANADMARVWRENAERLSSYTIAAPKNFKKIGSTLTKVTFGWSSSSNAVRYDVYRTVLSGSEVVKLAETTSLTHTVSDMSGRTIYYVKAVDAKGNESKLSNGDSR